MTTMLDSDAYALDGLDLPSPAHLIGGRRVAPQGAPYFSVLNPFDDSVVARVPDGGAEEIRAAVDAAVVCQPDWEQTPPADKQRLFLSAAVLVDRRRAHLVRLLAAETGASAAFANAQLDWSATCCDSRPAGSTSCRATCCGPTIRTLSPRCGAVRSESSPSTRRGTAPWCWRGAPSCCRSPPATQSYSSPRSEHAPISAGLVAGEILTEAGFPDGAVNVVTHGPGGAAAVTDVLVDDPRMRCLNFTGSAQTGRLLAARAGETLTRTVLELGGYNQVVVLEDADLLQAAKLTAFSAFLHQVRSA